MLIKEAEFDAIFDVDFVFVADLLPLFGRHYAKTGKYMAGAIGRS